MRRNLKFCYKGGRKYIHGTDIFNAVYKIFQHSAGSLPSNIEMSIHSIIRNNMTLVMQEDLLPSEKAAVNFTVSDNGDLTRLILIENDELVDCQYGYAEEEIIKTASYNRDKQTIALADYNEHSLIENIVALNKGLLSAMFPDVEGKWYFTKIKLNNIDLNQQSQKKIAIRLKKNMNFKLTQSEILLEDKPVGNIYFSLV